MHIAQALVTAAAVHLSLGVAFALPFVHWGVGRIDPDAREGTWGFRVLILPGAALLWPLLLVRWVRGAGPPEERTPHKRELRGGAAR